VVRRADACADADVPIPLFWLHLNGRQLGKTQTPRLGGIVNRAYAVIDDFLSHQEHVDLWDAFQETVVSPAELREWNRTYQLTDGEDPVNSAFQSRRA